MKGAQAPMTRFLVLVLAPASLLSKRRRIGAKEDRAAGGQRGHFDVVSDCRADRTA